MLSQYLYSTSTCFLTKQERKSHFVQMGLLTTDCVTLHHCLFTQTDSDVNVCVQRQWSYLERCCACVLSADGVSIVSPHDLINLVAFDRQRLLWRHHAQFLQLQEDKSP